MKTTYTSTQIRKLIGISQTEFNDYTRREKKSRITPKKGPCGSGNINIFDEEDFIKFKLVHNLKKIGCSRSFAIDIANRKGFENDIIKVILK